MQPIRVKTVQESDLRMLGNLARNIQRVLPVTQADIDAAAALGKEWVVWKVFEVSEPLDNMRGGTQLIIRQNSIQPGQNVRRVIFVSGPGGQTVVIRGTDYIVLPDAIADSLSYVKAFGGTEQRNLPDGYTELEYIESTGTQYIDTGINLTSDHNVEIKFNGRNQETFMFGGRTSAVSKSYGLFLNNVANVQPNFSFAQNPQAVANYNWLDTILKYQDKSLYWNGSSVVTYTETFSCDYPSYLFAMNNAGTAHEKKFTGKIYYTKIWNSGTLVRDFIPAKDSSNVIGMYDTVSGQFFTNQGTGDFVAGSTVSDPIEIYTDGTVETISIKDSNNILPANAQADVLYPVNIPSPATYIASANVNNGQQIAATEIRFYDANKSYLNYWTLAEYQDGRMYKKIGLSSNVKYVSISKKPNYESTPVSQIKLEKGEVMTPYFNGGTATAEMLLKVGDYQDVQSIIDGVVTRNVGIKVLDGTENWQNISGYYNISKTDLGTNSTVLPSASTDIICTHYKTMTGVPTETSVNVGASYVNFREYNISTLAGWTSWLTEQYNAGTPVILVYAIPATTESVAGQTLQVTDGDNIVEITQASLNGLELEAEYQAAVSLTIQEVQDANLDPNVEVTIN